jgi:class 3 adenylate cyclase
VRCSKCGAENRDGAKFCNECAAPLSAKCPSCGAINKPSAKFCDECSKPLGVGAQQSDPQPQPTESVRFLPEQSGVRAAEGERKTVTALFADIKGSMDLIEDLDPEEAREIVDPALKLMIEAVHRYNGYIVQSTGDGIFALFGAPVAHEDHPQRALYAALRLQEELRRYSDRLREQAKLPLQARVGVNTGEVVVRTIATDEAHTEYTPIGHSTGLASRMQTLAPVGSIAVTEATRKLCEGYFTFKSLGTTQVKGVTEPVAVHELTGLGLLRTRLQVAAQRGLTKFVGRQSELDQMKRALELARGGHGQIVAAMGEPGVGKSRLIYEFKAVASSGCLVLEAYSVSHSKASAYLPVIDLLKGYFEIAPDDDERKRREKIAGKLVILDRALEDALPYLYSLLGISEADDALAQFDPQTRRHRTLQAIKRILTRESLNQPLILIFEDLHWIDSETQALLNLLADRIATARIQLLVNYRPEYHHEWGNKTYYSQLRLDPLGSDNADQMLAALLGDAADLEPVKHLIIKRTEGNPFFIEEMVQALVEQGVLVWNGAVKLAKPFDQIRVPATVQAILASRIDRLSGDEKELLQTLAVLGRDFPLVLIKRVTGKPDTELERMLSALQLAEFIYEQPAVADVEYQFKHALTQEVAYNSQLTERRRLLHERAGQAIEVLYADRRDDHLTELAHHFDRSGNVPKAVEYLSRAGSRAAQQGVHSEAIGYFTRALELLGGLPEGAARDSQELDLQMDLTWSFFVSRGERRLAQKELAERVLGMAQQAEAPATLAGAHYVLGLARFYTGQFLAAREHLERAIELFGASPSRTYAVYFAQAAHQILVLILGMLGYPLMALKRAHELLAAARRSSDPYFIANSLFLDGMNRLGLRDTRLAAQRAEEMLSIATEHEMAFYLIVATFLRGWAMAAVGQSNEGIAVMRRSISNPVMAESSATDIIVWLLMVLAEICGKNGRAEEGLDLIGRGLVTAEQTGLSIHETELHRIRLSC